MVKFSSGELGHTWSWVTCASASGSKSGTAIKSDTYQHGNGCENALLVVNLHLSMSCTACLVENAIIITRSTVSYDEHVGPTMIKGTRTNHGGLYVLR